MTTIHKRLATSTIQTHTQIHTGGDGGGDGVSVGI